MYELFFKYYDITKEGVIINLKTNRKYKGTIANNGYLIFNTKINKKKYNWLVHRLIAIKYIPNPNNYPIINHIDGNKLNNSIDNLEWCTCSHNIKHAFNTGLKKPSGKTVLQIDANTHKIINIFKSAKEAERITGINHSLISRVCRGIGKTAGNYKWKYYHGS